MVLADLHVYPAPLQVREDGSPKQALGLADPQSHGATSANYTSCFPAEDDAVLHKTFQSVSVPLE